MNNIITLANIVKTFRVGAQNVEVLKDISFNVPKGDFTIIFGPSGSGKSTLLHVLLGLETPTTGSVTVLENNLYANWAEDDRSEFRKQHIGMVYQQPNWIKALTVVENISFPLSLLGVDVVSSRARAIEGLKSIGMETWADYLPGELSGGQQQKASLARAMITDPELIIADEPTGNLDFESGREVMELLVSLTKKGKTVIMVTHDLEYLHYAKSAIRIFDGKAVETYNEKEIQKMLKELPTKRLSEFGEKKK